MKGKAIADGAYKSVHTGLTQTDAILLFKQRVNQLGLNIICEDKLPDGTVNIKVQIKP